MSDDRVVSSLRGEDDVIPATIGLAVLPHPAPLPMPEQSLRHGRLRVSRQRTSPAAIGWRRFYLLSLTILTTAYATWVMIMGILPQGITILDICLIVLFIFLFAWISLSFASALAGFFCIVFGAGGKLGIDPQKPLPQLQTRTALLMPTYHEDPRRLIAGLQAMFESLAETGRLAHFDFFILSDSRQHAIALAEEREYLDLCQRLHADKQIFFRRRHDNSGRKAGNVADWVRRFGAAYPQMIVLDADSVMTGDAIVRLVAAMEQHSDVGVIQSVPTVVGGRTLFARMQQFSNRVYGPIVSYGVAWWHGAESNYWGHNAVIRTKAFADHAGLPELRGLRPFGGHVLSHDFVEAALLRRGGWAVHMVPYLQGSYEEGPPTLTDLLIRDRRWCQGNLQHLKVFHAAGLHWVSRMHMLVGIGHYFTAPLWGMMMLVGIAIPELGSGSTLVRKEVFSPMLYWHSRTDGQIFWIFIWSMAILLAPKAFGYLALLADRTGRQMCGGAQRMLISILCETVLSALMAPVVMYIQSRGVFEVLAGKDSGWDAQQRDVSVVSWRALRRRYAGLTCVGGFMGCLAYVVSPYFAAWMSPVIFGMVLSIPVVAVTSMGRIGDFCRRRGLFSIPEEVAPPAVLQRAVELRLAALDDDTWQRCSHPKYTVS